VEGRDLTRRLGLLIPSQKSLHNLLTDHRSQGFGKGYWEIIDAGESLRSSKVINPKDIKFFEKMLQKGDID
jgi:hypothetical protein